MKFFTSVGVRISRFAMVNIKEYNHRLRPLKEIVFIDPGVYDLVKGPEYRYIDWLHHKANHLKPNEWISIDYPGDMNPKYQELFIRKSIENNIRYRDNPNYIATVQSRYMDAYDFKFRLVELLDIVDGVKGKRLGIGNICRILKNNEFIDTVFKLLRQYVPQSMPIHFYGLSFNAITKYLPELEESGYDISVDSTKWLFSKENFRKYAGTKKPRSQYVSETFIEYINKLQQYFAREIEY